MGSSSRMAYATIYDVISKERGDLYAGGHKLENAKQKLYDHIARLLSVFALCDFRHDFQQGANIYLKVSEGKGGTVGQLFCKPVAGAFYAPDSSRYNELHKYLYETYNEKITSNHTAVAFFKSEMDNFFLNKFVAYKSEFAETAYARYYDMCAEISKDYSNDLDFAEFREKIAPEASRQKQVFYIDAQRGNPFEKIFNGAPGSRAKYFYNFATAMDAAPKSSSDAHVYMDTYVQVNTKKAPAPLISSIEKEYTSFNANTAINSFEHIEDAWTTNIKVDDYSMDFSIRNQASVNNLALAIVRGPGAGGAPTEIRKKIDEATLNEILVNHLFKSLGDRLQAYSMSHAGTGLTYRYVKEISPPKYTNDAKAETTKDKNIFVFTNDELNNYQMYMMGINTVMTGFNVVTAYINKAAAPITVMEVRKFFADRIAVMRTALLTAPTPLIVINNLETIQATLFEAFVRYSTNGYIKNFSILKTIRDDASLDATYFEEKITDYNFRLLRHLMTDNLLDYLRTYTSPKSISNLFIRSEFRRVDKEARVLNRDVASASLIGDTFKGVFERLQLLIGTISSILVNLQVSKTSATIIAHAIMANLYPNIREKLYKSGKLIRELTDRGARHSIYLDKLANIQQITGLNILDVSNQIIDDIIGATLTSDISEIVNVGIEYIHDKIDEHKNSEIYPGLQPMGDFYVSIFCIRVAAEFNYEQLMSALFSPYASVIVADKSSLLAKIKEAGPPQLADIVVEAQNTQIRTKFTKTKKAVKTRTRVITAKNKSVARRKETKQQKINTKRGVPSTKTIKSKSIKSIMSKLMQQKSKLKIIKKASKKAITAAATKVAAPTKASKKESKAKTKISAKTKTKVVSQKAARGTRLRGMRARRESALSAAVGGSRIPLGSEVLAVADRVEDPDSFITVNPVSMLFNIGRAFINLLNPFGGGGSKTRERESKLIDLCTKKLEFMAAALSQQPEFAAVLVAADRILSLIVDDFERVENSKSRPVVLRSSLSVIREEGEGQSGGGGNTMTITKQAPTIHIVGKVVDIPKSSSIVGPYSRIENAPKQKVATISKTAAKSLLEQRLAAFLWFGFSRGPEARRLETEIFKPLLPDMFDDIAGDAHNVLFWQLLFGLGLRPHAFFASEYDEGLLEHFEHGSRSPFKKARERRARKKASNAATRRLLQK